MNPAVSAVALTAEQIYIAAARDGLRPPPRLTVSEWADRYRILSSRSSAEPNQWRTSRTPYLRDIMDTLSPASRWERIVFAKGAQIGGPLALDTPLPTPGGWTTMGDVQTGDTLFDENGQPCRVISVSPVYRDRPCYRVRFSDGAEFISDAEHRWVVWSGVGSLSRQHRVKTTTGAMFADYRVRNRYRYAIDVAGPLVTPAAELPVDPYLLGVWLGNGAAAMNHLTFHEDDTQFSELLSDCGYSVELRLPWWRKGKAANALIDDDRERERDCYGRFAGVVEAPDQPSFMSCLRSLGLIRNKHIPAMYLRASVSQRLALLQGLMDTDGHCTKRGQCEYSCVSAELTGDVIELITSLGLKPSLYSSDRPAGKRTYKKRHYRVHFTAYQDFPVFRLERKLVRLRTSESRCRTSETFRRRIVSIEPVESVPVRCIEVDTPSHLYLAGRAMVPTHNTEAGMNWLAWIIHHCPGPALCVQPTTDMAKRLSKQRIDPMIEASEPLRNLVKDRRSRDAGNTMLAKEFPGGIMVLAGANSAVGLRSMPVRFLFLDEVDAYPADVAGEGDPVELAIARTRTYPQRKIYMVSTPTLTGQSRIERLYDESDQRAFELPCPHCGHFQPLEFTQLRWAKGKPREAQYHCRGCDRVIHENHKTQMLAKGEWVSHADGDGITAGFRLSSLYSPLGWFSWGEAAEQHERAGTNPRDLQVFFNTVLGESYAESGETPDDRRLYERREAYQIGTVPLGAGALTAGADVQRDRIEVEIVAWGPQRESWSIDYREFRGDTSQPEVWQQMTALLDETFPCEAGGTLQLLKLAVDSGFNTLAVYNWARAVASPRVMVVHGVTSAPSLLGASSAIEVGPQGRKVRYGIRLWPINVNIAKEELYRNLRLAAPDDGEAYPPGYCHFPMYSSEFFEQLCAEKLMVRTVNGYAKPYWQQIRARNEALDCRVYARAAAVAGRIDLWPDEQWAKVLDDLVPRRVDELPAHHGISQHGLSPLPKQRTTEGRDPWLD